MRRPPLKAAQPAQLAELADEGWLGARRRRPQVGLAGAADEPHDLQPPRAIVLGEPELTEGDAELRRPALAIDVDGAGPHRVPAGVLVGVVVHEQVALDPGGVQGEAERGPAIAVRVDHHADPVGRRVLIAPVQQPADRGRLVVVGPDPDVEGVLVVGDAELGRVARRPTLVGRALPEVVGDRRGRPAGVVEATVDGDRAGPPDRRRDPAAAVGDADDETQREGGEREADGHGEEMRERAPRWTGTSVAPSRFRVEPDRRPRHLRRVRRRSTDRALGLVFGPGQLEQELRGRHADLVGVGISPAVNSKWPASQVRAAAR
jgi:hypothetical protein